jgi:hypothetical protein
MEKLEIKQGSFIQQIQYFIPVEIDLSVGLTTVTRQTGEYKVDVTRHPKFPLAFGELASGGFPHCQ